MLPKGFLFVDDVVAGLYFDEDDDNDIDDEGKDDEDNDDNDDDLDVVHDELDDDFIQELFTSIPIPL